MVALVIALSGCVGPQDPQGPGANGGNVETASVDVTGDLSSAMKAGRLDSNIAKRFGALPLVSEPLINQWFLAVGSSGKERPLTGFSWSIPNQAAVPYPFLQQLQYAVLEVAPIPDPAASKVDRWVLLAFVENEGTAVINSWTTVSPEPYELEGPPIPTATVAIDQPDPSRPTRFFVGATNLQPGARVLLVIGAESAGPMDFAVAFRVLDHYPKSDERVARSVEDFLANVSGAPRLLPVTGQGKGFRHALYQEFSNLLVFSGLRKTDDATVIEAIPLAINPAQARDTTIHYDLPSGEGWGTASGTIFSDQTMGRWEVSADLHGETLTHSDVIVPRPSFFLPVPVPAPGGFSFFTVSGGGSGHGEATMRVTLAGAPTSFSIYFQALDLGASLEQLIGLPPAPAVSFVSKALPVPAVHERSQSEGPFAARFQFRPGPFGFAPEIGQPRQG
ncbi:MAG: hypothetical protein HY556_08965 [Euryarchaeota archaeon]|nr:hypothetical protein [Euryarchaeota archaeon]